MQQKKNSKKKFPFAKAEKSNPVRSLKPALPSVPAEWLYCLDHEVSAEMIAECCNRAGASGVECWTQAQIVELPIGEKASMDLERIECDLEDDYGNAYLKENGIICLYMVTIVPACKDEAKRLMKCIIEACGGYFCGDTDDFTPVVR